MGKGLDSKHGYCRFSETISRAMGGKNPVVALTGPTHAEEVARCVPTAIDVYKRQGMSWATTP